MCSVIGVISRTGGDVSAQARTLIMALKHRGPEAFGVATPESVAKCEPFDSNAAAFKPSPVFLGHCLLSTTGHGVQPFTESGLSAAHNGQIYNYAEIGRKLGLRGLSSDSEVIVRFLAKELSAQKEQDFGLAAKHFMEAAMGEYAIGALHNRTLYAFRDFIGQKPIWFGENPALIAFASEPAPLAGIGIHFPRPLLPGHLLKITAHGLEDVKIFDMADFRANVQRQPTAPSIASEFTRTIEMQTRGLSRAAVLFSGGVDSSLIAKAVSQKAPGTKLFAAGTEGSHDLAAAESSSRELGLPLEKIVVSMKEAERLTAKAIQMLGSADPMQLGIALPELACAERISRQGFKVVFSGQGSDEVFCGYNSYAIALENGGYPAVERELWEALGRMWSRNFFRDDTIISGHALELRLPFFSRNFLAAAMAIPPQHKILSPQDRLRKHPIRELARLYGISASIAERPKKAMQYGSGAQKIVSLLLK